MSKDVKFQEGMKVISSNWVFKIRKTIMVIQHGIDYFEYTPVTRLVSVDI